MINNANSAFKQLILFFWKLFPSREDHVFHSIFRGSIVTFAARVCNAFLLIFINLIIARRFGAEMVGLIAALNSVLIVTSIFSLAGTQISVLRFIPEFNALNSNSTSAALFQRLHKMVTSLALLVSVLLIAVCPFLNANFPDLSIAAWFWGIPIILTFFSLSQLDSEAMRALQQIRLYSLSHILPALTFLFFLIASTYFLPHKVSPILAFYASFIATFLINESLIQVKTRWGNTKIKLPSQFSCRSILTISFPMGFTAGMYLILANADQFMLAFLRSGREAGIYSIASKLALLTSFIIFSVNSVSAAHFSELFYSGRKQELFNAAKKSSRLIFWASLPIFIVLIFSGRFVLGLFGRDFKTGYLTLILLLCGQFINVMAGSVSIYLNMTGGQKTLQIIVLLTSFANLSLNYWLIPHFGMVGAAVIDMLCLAFWNVAAAKLIYRRQGVCISFIPTWLCK